MTKHQYVRFLENMLFMYEDTGDKEWLFKYVDNLYHTLLLDDLRGKH